MFAEKIAVHDCGKHLLQQVVNSLNSLIPPPSHFWGIWEKQQGGRSRLKETAAGECSRHLLQERVGCVQRCNVVAAGRCVRQAQVGACLEQRARYRRHLAAILPGKRQHVCSFIAMMKRPSENISMRNSQLMTSKKVMSLVLSNAPACMGGHLQSSLGESQSYPKLGGQ